MNTQNGLINEELISESAMYMCGNDYIALRDLKFHIKSNDMLKSAAAIQNESCMSNLPFS